MKRWMPVAVGLLAMSGSFAVLVSPSAAASPPSPGDLGWVALLAPGSAGWTRPAAVAAAPGGSSVFVAAKSSSGNCVQRFDTVAYVASSGRQRWHAFGPAAVDPTCTTGPRDIAVGPTPAGPRLFVAGTASPGTGSDFLTLAYRQRDGKAVWSRSKDVGSYDGVVSMGLSPDGETLFVTGVVGTWKHADGYLTVAYRTSDGRQQWARRLQPGGDGDPSALAVTPDGSTVLVTGGTEDAVGGDFGFTTVAYDAGTGAERWVSRYDGVSGSFDYANALVVSPDSGAVFVTGPSNGGFATVAYATDTGVQTWVSRSDVACADRPTTAAISPDGTSVFVAGLGLTSDCGAQTYRTIAYASDTGAERWASTAPGPGGNGYGEPTLVADPDGTQVFLAGEFSHCADYDCGPFSFQTVAYDTVAGSQNWLRRWRHGGDAWSVDAAVALTGSNLFVTGAGDDGIATVSYST